MGQFNGNENIRFHELLDECLLGTATPEMRAELENLMRGNLQLQNEAEGIRSLVFSIRNLDKQEEIEEIKNTRSKVSQLFAEVEQEGFSGEEEVKVKKLQDGLFRYRKLLAAASIAAVFIVSVIVYSRLFPPVEPTKLYAEHFNSYENLLAPNLRGEENIVFSQLSTALRLYENQEYEQSILFFDSYFAENKGDDSARLYRAIALMNLNRFGESLPDLKMAASSNSHFSRVAKWYLALAYLQTDSLASAKEMLGELSGSYGMFQNEATLVLKKMN